MCLIFNHTKYGYEPQIAKENIRVYKVIARNGQGCFYSLYINDKFENWTRGFHYVETTPFDTMIVGYNETSIYGHAFHSKKTRKAARDLKDDDEIVVEMYIPKGAKYYENKTEYASSAIVYPEIQKNELSRKRRRPHKTRTKGRL